MDSSAGTRPLWAVRSIFTTAIYFQTPSRGVLDVKVVRLGELGREGGMVHNSTIAEPTPNSVRTSPVGESLGGQAPESGLVFHQKSKRRKAGYWCRLVTLDGLCGGIQFHLPVIQLPSGRIVLMNKSQHRPWLHFCPQNVVVQVLGLSQIQRDKQGPLPR